MTEQMLPPFKQEYPAIVHKDPQSNYGVSFPDFPGCVSAGDTLPLATTAAAEALGMHIAGMAKDGQGIPMPSDGEGVDLDGGTLVMIQPDEQVFLAMITTADDE